MRKLCFLASAFSLITAVSTTAFALTKVESIVVAPQGPTVANSSFAMASSSGLHLLVAAPKGSRQVYLHDGVEGPRFDRATGQKQLSADGKRHAYTALVGTDAILVLDGKEIARTPAEAGMNPFPAFGFTKTGRRFWYVSPMESGGVQKLVVDGIASEPTNGINVASLVFSPDESRYAVLFTKHEEGRGELLMVDGKSVGFQGGQPQFSPDGKSVLTIGIAPDTYVLRIDGRQASRAPLIHSVHMSTGGLNFLVLSASRNPSGDKAQFLGSGGKKIEGSECASVDQVLFSPNGKRYAALCNVSGRKYVLLDGKKGLLYDRITDLQFTADSSKLLYVAHSDSAGGQFLVTEDEESDGYQVIQPVLGAGKRIGYVARVMGQPDAKVIVDGKASTARGASYLGFSPDGSRYAFQGGHPQFPTLYLDGVEQSGVGAIQTNFSRSPDEPWFTFSPDNKYLAHFGYVKGEVAKRGLVVNGKLLDVAPNGLYCQPFFTPDSNHIIHVRGVPGGGYEILVDGKVAEKVTSLPTALPSASGQTPPFEMGADGVFTFIGIADGAAKRYRITPDADTSVATFFASAP